MRFALKEYQRKAIAEILKNLADARIDVQRNRKVAFALSATTGAGKTVMATAVIEALFEGSDEFEIDPDPSAVVLWVTDDPSLNEQTRRRMIESGDRLDIGQLKIIGDSGFDQPKFDTGNVYFLNVQKLRADTTWVQHSNNRAYTLWDTIRNTIEDPDRTLYMVLDEAHRGMRSLTSTTEQSQRTTIVQRLINGTDEVPPVPIVWGISATVDRFTEAMKAAQEQGRTTLPPVTVDPKDVQESGLLKDTILLDFPDETGSFETVLLRSAIRETREASALWAAYTRQEKLPEPVLPLAVVQVPNKVSDPELGRLVEVIQTEWPELPTGGIANVFGEHIDLNIGNEVIPYIAPQDVQEATQVRVLFAKDAVSTGWDCPRAEVLFSLRPAKDRTHITQLLGRMVRTPLARRVESDERLNAVTCVLPLFDRSTAIDVAAILTGEKEDRGDPDSASTKGAGKKVLTSPIKMLWNPNVPEEIREVLTALPSESAPRGETKPIKRLLALAAVFAVDNLMEAPNQQAQDRLFSILDGQMAKNAYAVEQGMKELYSADIRRIKRGIAEDKLVESTRQEVADTRTIDDAFRTSTRGLGAEIANQYVKRLALTALVGGELDFHTAKARLAALLMIDGVLAEVESEADKVVGAWLVDKRVDIKELPEGRRVLYEDIKLQARDPQLVDIVAPVSRIENTRDADDNLLPTRQLHLLSDEDGNFPIESLNDWERRVLDAELARTQTIGWYRNPSRATDDALLVPYLAGKQWKSMQPDFVFFTRRPDDTLAASIVDPHGAHLADALPKLRGLARFAQNYGDSFSRIEAIAEIDKELRVLELTDPAIRQQIQEASNASELYSAHGSEFK